MSDLVKIFGIVVCSQILVQWRICESCFRCFERCVECQPSFQSLVQSCGALWPGLGPNLFTNPSSISSPHSFKYNQQQRLCCSLNFWWVCSLTYIENSGCRSLWSHWTVLDHLLGVFLQAELYSLSGNWIHVWPRCSNCKFRRVSKCIPPFLPK